MSFQYSLLERHPRSSPLPSPARPGLLRETNIRDLVHFLRIYSPCSRADLVRVSGLTAPTVSAAISTIQRRGLVTVLGPGSSSGGRPPGLLEFNARHGYVVGVDIGGSKVRCALADLNGHIIDRWAAPLKLQTSPKAIVSMIAASIDQMTGRQKVSSKRILQIVAGAPGITDAAAGRVLSAPNLTDWEDIPLRDMLQKETDLPVSIENDVNLGALGEGSAGVARGIANFVFISLGTGVGAGIVLNGALHHGSRWSAGEVGYLLIPGLEPDPPSSGRPGVLEKVIGGRGIVASWLANRPSPTPIDDVNLPRATDIFDLAVNGDLAARDCLQSVAEHLAYAITNLSLILDISVVVLSGGVGEHPALLQAVALRLERNQLARAHVVMSSLRGEAPVHGAIWLGLRIAEENGYRSPASASQSAGALPAR
jgi:glucokinase